MCPLLSGTLPEDLKCLGLAHHVYSALDGNEAWCACARLPPRGEFGPSSITFQKGERAFMVGDWALE